MGRVEGSQSRQLPEVASPVYNETMKRSGHADLPLHRGNVPQWLAQRMAALGGAISESIILNYGTDELLARLADPFLVPGLRLRIGDGLAFVGHYYVGDRRS